MFTFERRVTYSDLAPDERASVPQMVRYMQDTSIFHSESLGVGVDYLYARHKAWILASWQIQFHRRPKLGEQIATSTWPYKFDSLYGYRNFVIRDEQKQVLAAANSIWIMVDTQTLHPLKLTPEDTDPYESGEKFPMEYAPRKIRLPKEWEEKESFLVTRQYLDTNGHVNNTKYVDMALEYMDPQVQIRQIRVEFKNAAMYGDQVIPRIHRQDPVTTIELAGPGRLVYAAVEITV